MQRSERLRQQMQNPIFFALVLGFSICALALAAPQAAPPRAAEQTKAKIVSLFDHARTAEATRDFREAARLYDSILKIDPSLAEVWTNKGLALYELAKYQEAQTAFSKAAGLKPRLLTPQLFLGILYLKSGEPQKARKHLLAASALDPRHPQATYELANAYAQLEQFDKAVRLDRQLVERDPKMEQAWYKLGIAYLNWSKSAARKLVDSSSPSAYRKLLLGELLAVGGAHLDAEARYLDAVQSQPNLVEARLALGQFFLDYQVGPDPLASAHRQFEEAKALAPEDLRVARMMARLSRAEGDDPETPADQQAVQAGVRNFTQRLEKLKQAQSSRELSSLEKTGLAKFAYYLEKYDLALRTLISLRPSAASDEANYWLSLVCRALARETFLKAIKVNPESYRGHLLLADLANSRHNSAEALAEYEKAVTLGPGDPEVHLVLVQFLTSQGKDDDALTRAENAVAKFPNHSGLNYQVGRLLLRQKKPQEAQEYFVRALEADPSLLSARAGLADSLAAQGDNARAIREMKLALGYDEDGSCHYRLGRWLQAAGRSDEAAEMFAASSRLKAEKLKQDSARFESLRPSP